MLYYEAPRLELKKLTIFESIATTDCWGGNNFYFDHDGDGYEPCERLCLITDVNKKNGKCHLRTDLKDYIHYRFFSCDSDGFRKWCDASKINNHKVLNNTGVTGVGQHSGGTCN